ncbi:MAG: DUF2269 domain-containing protein, partial [Candidatus Dormibacteraeota bacterium]|nr:DUF2269 domain-containing protein [Candidatus Dormibacteraeota bacterium]
GDGGSKPPAAAKGPPTRQGKTSLVVLASFYTWLKFLHLAGLGIFLLGHGVSAAGSLVLRRPLADPARGMLLQLSMRANYVAFPGLVLLLVTGVWMGFLGSWWRFGWIWTAIVVLFAVFVVMSALSLPYHRARDAVRDNQPTAELESRLKGARPIVLMAVGGIGLLAIVFLMVFRPF